MTGMSRDNKGRLGMTREEWVDQGLLGMSRDDWDD